MRLPVSCACEIAKLQAVNDLPSPGDALVMCTAGLAEPLCGEPELAAHLAARWGTGTAPGLAAYLSDAQTRVKGYADDRTVVTVWDTDE